MKKSISLVIVLVLIFSLLAPIGAYANESNLDKLYNKLYNSKYADLYRENELISVDNLFTIKDYLKGKGYVSDFIDDIYGVINTQENEDLKLFLYNKYNVNMANVNKLKDIVFTWEEAYKEDLKDIAESFKAKNANVPEKWDDVILALKNDIFDAFPEEKENIKNALIEPTAYKVFELSVDLYDVLLNNLIVKEKNAAKDLEFSIDKENLYSAIKDIENDYINEPYRLPDEINLDYTLDRIMNVVNEYYSKVKADLQKELSDKGIVVTNEFIAKLFKSLVKEENYISYKEPTTPSTGGGTSTPSEPKLPEVTVPEDEKLPATVTLGEDQIDIRVKEGTANVSLDSRAAVKAVEKLRDKAGEDREAVLNIDLSGVESNSVNVEFSYDLIKAAADNNVSLNMVFDDMEVMIPADVLGAIDIAKGDKVVFRTENVTQLVNEAVGEDQDVKMGIDLYLEVVRNGSTTRVDQFNAPVVVKIEVKGLWNRDKLAVYYLNENNNTLEFVTGKIVDNQIIIRLSHFSKYLVIESNKTFSDITNHWAKLFIESMAAKNVVGGYSDGTFRPNNNITRAEFSKMILEGLEVELVKYNGEFTDVKASNWYADYLATMKKLGLAEGYNDGTFKPDQYITRAEIAVILSNVIDVEVDKDEINTLLANYTDKDQIPDWAIEAIAKVVKSKVMVGDNNRFMPSNNTTRAESVTTIYRIYNR